MELDDVYEARSLNEETQAVQHAHDEPEPAEVVDKGEAESVPPTPETAQPEPEVDWRAEAEKARKAAEEAERKAKGIERALAEARAKVREQPSFEGNPAEYVENIRREMAQQVQLVRIESMQAAARARHADYDEKEAVFASLAEQNPYLAAQLAQSSDPAEFAYKTAAFHMEMQSAGGSLDELKKRIRAEVEADKSQQFQAKAQSLPKTLAGAQGTGRTSANVFTGPTSLDDIYAPKRGK